MNQMQEMKELVRKMNGHRQAYYNRNAPDISDREYDRMFDRLEMLEKATGIILSDSPTQNVGCYPVSALGKVRHPRPLLSLDKTKQKRGLLNYMGNRPALLMLKLDGLTVKLVYEDGQLLQASTRGDGETGEDITHNIPAFRNVPCAIPYLGHLVVVGEALIYKDDFARLKDSVMDSNGIL